MVFVVSWQLVSKSEYVIEVTKHGDLNNSKMYLTDNLNNRYDVITVTGDGATDVRMVLGVTYYSTFIFRPPKPGAYKFIFHDDDNKQVINNIVLDKPSIYIYDIQLKGSPTTITYTTDKWTASETEQGAFKLAHTKYPNCQVMEAEPGDPQGKLINTIDIGSLKYEIYRSQQPDWSQREYVVVGGLGISDPIQQPKLIVTIPYDNSMPCLEDAGSILASLKEATP